MSHYLDMADDFADRARRSALATAEAQRRHEARRAAEGDEDDTDLTVASVAVYFAGEHYGWAFIARNAGLAVVASDRGYASEAEADAAGQRLLGPVVLVVVAHQDIAA